MTGVSGGTKPQKGTRRSEKYQDGLRKRGGVGAKRHAGPERASKTRSKGVKGAQLQKRVQP